MIRRKSTAPAGMSVLDLFDALHPEPTWRAWRAFISAFYGLPLDKDGLALFQRCTGRTTPREGGYPEAVAISGVQCGKTDVASCLADHAVLTGAPGTHALLVGQDQRGAVRSLLRYARQPFETIPAFRNEITRETGDTLELRRGTSLSAYPCRPATLRGLRANIVCIDELAHFITSDGRPVDTEMVRVARGRVATTGGRIAIFSNPHAPSGALFDFQRKHYGVDDSSTLIWQAPAPTMNPTLSADYLSRMEQDDPEAFRSEVLGEFREGLTNLFDMDVLADAVEAGVRERLPVEGVRYVGFVDAASGSGKDSFAVGIAHKDGERTILDVSRAWAPPFNPSGVISEAADMFKRYGLAEVSGDKYAPGFVAEGFRVHAIKYTPCERATSETYLEALPLVNAGAVVLLDDDHLLRELRGLERRRGTAGRDRVDHRPGAHDDRACAATGALVSAMARPKDALHKATWGRRRGYAAMVKGVAVADRRPIRARAGLGDRAVLKNQNEILKARMDFAEKFSEQLPG